jgi:preprotein translocase SecE subunit
MAQTAPKPKKRLVKNPETFRERAVKASEEVDKPTRTAAPKRIIGSVFKGIGKVLKKVFGPIFRLRIFRIIGKILFPEYFRSSWRELKLVKWPNWKQSRQLTFAVLVFAIIFGITVAIVDYGLDKLFRDILLK